VIFVPWIPSFRRGFTVYAVTIVPFIFIRRDKAWDEGIMAHEFVHVAQVRAMGWWSFYWSYVTSAAFRRGVEAQGYAKEKEVNDA
jgi:hypothetical protein